MSSSRSTINRALGETSLELKCLFLFGISLLLVITISFLMYWRVTGAVVKDQNPVTGRVLANQGMAIFHWERVFKLLAKAENDSAQMHDFSGFMSEDIGSKLIANQQYKWQFIRMSGPAEDGTRPDAFERRLLARFMEAGYQEASDDAPRQIGERLVSDGPAYGDEYHYYQPIYAQPTCVGACHRSLPGGPGFDPASVGLGGGAELNPGDLMGMVRVTLPYGPTQDSVKKYWNWLLAVAIITAFLAMVAFYFVIRYVVVRPVRHLRNVSDAISHGNTSLRADIHTADEFESLAMAFNRMLGHLVAVQDELRQVNTDLDAKVDELAQLNMQLYELNRIKSDFLATMSHELRTPLNSILGFSDVLGSIDSLDDKQKRYVEHIRRSGRMLLDMINNILDLAKMESGKMDLRLAEFHIGPVIDAQCDMARPLSEKKNIDLETALEPDLPPIYQDQARVQQILNNLLSNAIKFTPEGGRVRVAAGRNAVGDLVIEVIDTGVGIADEDQQAIFEKFRQGRTAMPGGDAMTREYSGTGLGLSIVRELCRLLGGDVSVESELGVGSTFTVRLPWRLERPDRSEGSIDAAFDDFAAGRLDRLRAVSSAGRAAGP